MFSAIIIGILALAFLIATALVLACHFRQKKEDKIYNEWRKKHNLPGDPKNRTL